MTGNGHDSKIRHWRPAGQVALVYSCGQSPESALFGSNTHDAGLPVRPSHEIQTPPCQCHTFAQRRLDGGATCAGIDPALVCRALSIWLLMVIASNLRVLITI